MVVVVVFVLMVVDGTVLLLAVNVLVLFGNDIFTSSTSCSQFCRIWQ